MVRRATRTSRARAGTIAGVAALALAASACGGGGSSTTTTAGTSKGTSPGAKPVTIQFAQSGLGTEGDATQAAITSFEKANPDIHVRLVGLSSDSTTYLQQIEQRFISGSTTPDVLESDVTYPAKFAKSGWIMPLDGFHPDLSQFFKTEVQAGQYKGKTYAIPWFDNPEGLFYRTDLIKTPPSTPAQVVSDAQAAMKSDKSLKEGLAFEGAKYEGALTAFLTFAGGFGGKLDPANLDTKANLATLNFMHDTIYKYHIAPQAVTGWQEGQVQQEFTSGHTPFAIDYPFVFSVAAKSGPAKGHVGFIPFPSSTGTPGSALGGEMLAINAKSANKAAAWKLIQYLTTPSVQVQRAVATGDPPALPSAYTSTLYSQAPYFQLVKTANQYAAPRPVTPQYLAISSDLQTMISSVLSNLTPASAALSHTAAAVKSLAGAS